MEKKSDTEKWHFFLKKEYLLIYLFGCIGPQLQHEEVRGLRSCSAWD